MTALLSVKNLKLSFSGDESINEVVHDISFNLNKNEVLGIVGESGSGKSVTALSILGLSRAKANPKSSVCFKGQELLNAPKQVLKDIRGKKIGFIFQEPMSSLNPLHKIGAQVAEAILIGQKISSAEAKSKALELLNQVGLKNADVRYNAYPFELSGGERQRVMIAMAISNKPDILIADEPTTALDVTIQKQIIDLILDLKKSLGMAVIFISHDLKLVAQIADKIIVMYKGKIVEKGDAKSIFEHPAHSYTKKLISSINVLKNKEKKYKNILLSIQNLSVRYTIKKNILGKTTRFLDALKNVSLDIKNGETLGIVGESGSGKTTLGLAISNLIKYQGKIEFQIPMTGLDFRKNVQIIFQDPYNSLNPRMNILQIVGEGLKIHKKELNNNMIEKEVISALEQVGLGADDIKKYPHEFSGGERQRIAIARAIILKPKLIVLDEPTSALDVTIQKQIITLLKNLQKKYHMTYIFISHDMRSIMGVSDRIAVMKNGSLVEINSASQVLNHPKNDYTKSLIKASIF